MGTSKIKPRHLDEDFKLPLDKLEEIPSVSDLAFTALASSVEGEPPVIDPVIQRAIDEAKAQIARQEINFANSISELEESGDTSKVYVLPNGNLVAYMKSSGEPIPNFTNLADTTLATDATLTPDSEGWIEDKRINSSKNITDAVGWHISNIIQCSGDDVIRAQGMDIFSTDKKPTLNPEGTTNVSAYARIYLYENGVYYDSSTVANNLDKFITINNNYLEFSLSELTQNFTNHSFDAIRIGGCPNDADLSKIIITVNEEITYTEGVGYAWQEMGLNIFAGACTDLIGIVGENNVIYLSDNNLPSGNYTLKYGDETYDTIGTITVE